MVLAGSPAGKPVAVTKAANLYYFITMRSLMTILAACLAVQAQIPAQDSRNTDTPNTDTHFVPKTYKNIAEWQARKDFLRKQILSAAGLMPFFSKNDLHPQIFGRVDRPD